MYLVELAALRVSRPLAVEPKSASASGGIFRFSLGPEGVGGDPFFLLNAKVGQGVFKDVFSSSKLGCKDCSVIHQSRLWGALFADAIEEDPCDKLNSYGLVGLAAE